MENKPKIKSKDLEEFNLRYSLGTDGGMDSDHFLRIKITEGALSSKQAQGIAELSDKYGNGYLEVTDRQSIQLHWIDAKDAPKIFLKMDEMGFTTDKCGQSYPGTKYGDVRNICTCPVAGHEKGELFNVRPLAEELNQFFIGNEDFLDMPRKFKISLSGCGIDCARSQMQDLGLFAIERNGETGFGAVIGGSLGASAPGPVIAKPLNVFIPPEEIFEVVKSMAEIHRDNSNRENKAKSRFKWLVKQWGVKKVREKLEEKIGGRLERAEYNGPKVSGEEHIGVQEQNDGRYYINIPLIGGKLSSAKLREVAKIAKESGTGELRTTPYQNLIILNLPKEKVTPVLEKLKDHDMTVEGSRHRWTDIGCASDFCGKAAEPYPKDVIEELIMHLEKKFGERLNEAKMNIRANGCPFDCGLRAASDIGLLGRKIEEDGSAEERYNLYLGGRFGKDARFVDLTDLVAKNVTLSRLKKMIEGLLKAFFASDENQFRNFLNSRSEEELRKIVQEEFHE